MSGSKSAYSAAPSDGTVTGTGVHRAFTFAEHKNPCLFSNGCLDKQAYVRVNATASAVIATGTYDLIVASGQTVDLSCGGRVNVKNGTAVWNADPGTLFSVTGLGPAEQ